MKSLLFGACDSGWREREVASAGRPLVQALALHKLYWAVSNVVGILWPVIRAHALYLRSSLQVEQKIDISPHSEKRDDLEMCVCLCLDTDVL